MVDVFAKCQVIPNLYFSIGLESAIKQINDARSKIRKVVFVSSSTKPLDIKDFDKLETSNYTIEDKTLLPKLPLIHEQISVGIQAGGAWIICNDDEEILLNAIITSFLMTTLYKNYSLRKSRRMVNKLIPISGEDKEFNEQLQIWEQMGARIDTKHLDWINFQKTRRVSHEDLLKGLLAQESKKSTRYVPLQRHKRSASMTELLQPKTEPKILTEQLFKKWKVKKLEISALPSPSIGSWGYCCSACGKKLFASENIINHTSDPITLDVRK